MPVKTNVMYLKGIPQASKKVASATIKRLWKPFLPNIDNSVEYTKDRFNHFSSKEKAEIKKAIRNMSKKDRAKFRKDFKFTFSETKHLAIKRIEFVPSHQRRCVFKIIKDIYRAIRGLEVNPIKIAILKQRGKPDRYICYDGQHTIILLYLLGYKKVPIEVKVVKDIADVRELFRLANGKGIRGKVSAVEDFRQEVLRYVEDGIRDAAAILAHQIQQLLVKNNIAMDGIGNIRNSISRTKELFDLKTKAHQQKYIDCYKHRTNSKIYITGKNGGLG